MRRIKFLKSDFATLRAHLLRGATADEEAALLLTSSRADSDDLDLLVRRVVPVPDDALLSKHRAGLEIAPDFIAPLLKEARRDRGGIIVCHSHPFSTTSVHFSGIDDGGEEALFPRMQARTPGPHASIVFGQESCDARVWLVDSSGPVAVDELTIIGDSVESIATCSARAKRPALSLDESVARQILAIGEAAQRRLSAARVGVVGAGGLGSLICDALIRMGVGAIVPVDRDALKQHNLARQANGGSDDVGAKKVSTIEAAAKRIGFGTHVQPVAQWIQEAYAARALLGCDVVIAVTDNMKSRVFAARLGHQYAIPIVSAGIDVIASATGTPPRVGGHVAVQHVDGRCLDCLGLIDHAMLDRENMTKAVRQANPYRQGRGPDDPAPSAIAFNQTVSGLVATEVLQLLTASLRSDPTATYLVYDGNTGETKRVYAKAVTRCHVCDEVRLRGDALPLPIEAAEPLIDC